MSAVSEQNLVGTGAHAARVPLAVPRRLLRMRSDTALAERFAAGDEAAFDVIYERHRQTVLAVCMGILGTAHDAEDATQETFSSLAVALRSHPPAELRPWLTRVARNASIDTTRRRKHRLLTIDGEIPEIPARPAAGGAELDTVLDGIRELPESQRTALLMRELGGHSYAEIAGFLETDEDAVRGLIARARVGLRSFRAAAELPCTTARAAIEAEPDGRRHDKTVRRHLRGCSSCRSYRSALRDDVKALRAVCPWQAGGLAGSGIAGGFGGGGMAGGGAITAAKGAMVGFGLSQMAATCAATVCAMGAFGGVVLLNPSSRLFEHAKAVPGIAHHHATRHSAPIHTTSTSAAAELSTRSDYPHTSVVRTGAAVGHNFKRHSETSVEPANAVPVERHANWTQHTDVTQQSSQGNGDASGSAPTVSSSGGSLWGTHGDGSGHGSDFGTTANGGQGQAGNGGGGRNQSSYQQVHGSTNDQGTTVAHVTRALGSNTQGSQGDDSGNPWGHGGNGSGHTGWGDSQQSASNHSQTGGWNGSGNVSWRSGRNAAGHGQHGYSWSTGHPGHGYGRH